MEDGIMVKVMILVMLVAGILLGVLPTQKNGIKITNDDAITEFSKVGIGMSDLEVIGFFSSKNAQVPQLKVITDGSHSYMSRDSLDMFSSYDMVIEYSSDYRVSSILFIGQAPTE